MNTSERDLIFDVLQDLYMNDFGASTALSKIESILNQEQIDNTIENAEKFFNNYPDIENTVVFKDTGYFKIMVAYASQIKTNSPKYVTDEEIEKECPKQMRLLMIEMVAFGQGAKWMREQIFNSK